jgi:hypothetical protein
MPKESLEKLFISLLGKKKLKRFFFSTQKENDFTINRSKNKIRLYFMQVNGKSLMNTMLNK